MHPIQWNRDRVRRIVLIKMRYIGDTVLVTPLINALKQSLPTAEICLLTNREAAPVVQGQPKIDSLMVFDYERAKKDRMYLLKFLRLLRRRKFDMVLDLTLNDRSALFTRLTGAPYRLGYAGGPVFYRLAYTHRVPYRFGTIHTVDHHLMMAKCLGLPVSERHPELVVDKEDLQAVRNRLAKAGVDPSRPYALIHPGARRWYKSWPIDRFARLADTLVNPYGLQVVLSGGPGDRAACSHILSLMAESAIDLCGRIPLAKLPALIRESAVLIGNDSAPIHIATAVNTPVVALFGPTRWEDWQPRRDHDHTLSVTFPCRPCGHSRRNCPKAEAYCMSKISVKQVLTCMGKLMRC